MLRGWRYAAVVVAVLLMSVFGIRECGRQMVTGQVVDAVTGEPIEGAAVLIDWWEPGPGPPGLAGSHQLEWKEALSDAQGRFTVPRHSTFGSAKEFNMAVYKKGYVCWNSQKVFPSNKAREGFSLKNGMKIILEPFRDEYSNEEHAFFTVYLAPTVSSKIYEDAIVNEKEIAAQVMMKKYQESIKLETEHQNKN